MCGLCQTMQPLSQLIDLYIRGSYGIPVPVRLCIRCASPRMAATTTAGHLQLTQLDVPRILGFAFGLTIAILNVMFGGLVGGEIGLLVALVGILAGAGISVAFAVSVALPHGDGIQL